MTVPYTFKNAVGTIPLAQLDDNFTAVVDTTTLASATGATSVGFQQAGSTTLTTVDAKLKESVSVLDFGADPTGVANSSTAFNNAMSAAKVVKVPPGIYKLDTTITRPVTCILEVDPTVTFTGVGEILNSGTAYGNTIPQKTIFGKLTIRDADYTVAYPNGFVNDPDMGQILRLDGKTEPGQCGVFLSGDEREPVLGSAAYVGFHTRHNNSINTPQVWGFNPVVVKSVSDASAGAPTIIIGDEISVSNNTSACGLPQKTDSVTGLFVSYIHTSNYASAAISTGGYSAVNCGWNNGLWLDGVHANGTLISLHDEVSGNLGVLRGIDFVSVASFVDGAVTLGNNHKIVGNNTSGVFVDLLRMNTSNQVALGQEGTATAILGIPVIPGNTSSNTAAVDVGISTTTQSWIDFHSSGNNNDYDARIYAAGGTTIGTANLTLYAGGISVTSSVKPSTTQSYDLGSAPLEWSNIYTQSLTASTSVRAASLTVNGTSTTTAGMDIGISTTTTSFLDFHSSATSNDYDFRLLASGGTTVGTGALQAVGSVFSMACDVRPSTTNARTLGTAALTWASMFTGYINLSQAAISAATGTINLGGTTATTVGATGAAAALPAQPLGYMIAYVGTAQVKIPYYTA